MPKSGKLELIIGPMFSGKSTELIKHVRMMKVINAKYIIIKPKIDDRYEKDKIVSHNKDSESCIVVSDLNDITNKIIKNYKYIIIDEGQFLKNLKTKVLYWVEKLNKSVIISGLDGDFNRKPIGEIIELIPYADICHKMTALCKICNDGTIAPFSHRILNNNNNQILIGSDDLYIPVCRKHYINLN